MTLRNLIARHARTVLVRADHFGEEVTYTPKGGAPRTVRCVVDRQQLQREESSPQIARWRAVLAVPNDADVGITAFTAGDKVTLAMRLGDTDLVARAATLLAVDEGIFLIEVRS